MNIFKIHELFTINGDLYYIFIKEYNNTNERIRAIVEIDRYLTFIEIMTKDHMINGITDNIKERI
jgi:hypothetical protein